MPQNAMLSTVLILSLILTPSVNAGGDHGVRPHSAESVGIGAQQQESGDSELASGPDERIRLDARQRTNIDLQVRTLYPREVKKTLTAPGEVVANRYGTSVVSPLKSARILQRHIVLGEHVKKGQPLVTLFSDELSQAQTDYVIANKEWRLVSKLGKQAVGRKRYEAADAALKQAKVQLRAFGITQAEIERLAAEKSELPLGQFSLKAPFDGIVQSDGFLQGEQVDSGQPLITLVDENEVWVEALLPATVSLPKQDNTQVSVTIGERTVDGRIIQIAHTVDERTRTRMVRVAVTNEQDWLHPGLFARVEIEQAAGEQAYIVPEQALIRTADGDWAVFYETKPGDYQLKEIEVVADLQQKRAISGLEPGTSVVVAGAFFLASEQAKSGFDTHGH